MEDHAATIRAIVESATDAIVTADSGGSIVTWNPSASAMFGHTAEEAVGRSLTLLVPERFHAAHTAAWRGSA